MGLRVGLLVLFVLGASWACDARELMTGGLSIRETVTSDVSVLQINYQESEGEVEVSDEVGRNAKLCTLCEEFASEALDYLMENKTQTQIIESLHETCSQLLSLEQKCITLVDYYVPLLFEEIGTMQPGDFCQKVNLCELMVTASEPTSEDKCEICHDAISEVLLKLKDPDTQLEIIQLLMKACDTVKSHVKKCKTLVFEYGPLILANAEQFLEKTDMCTVIHACDVHSADSKLASPAEEIPMVSVL